MKKNTQFFIGLAVGLTAAYLLTNSQRNQNPGTTDVPTLPGSNFPSLPAGGTPSKGMINKPPAHRMRVITQSYI